MSIKPLNKRILFKRCEEIAVAKVLIYQESFKRHFWGEVIQIASDVTSLNISDKILVDFHTCQEVDDKDECYFLVKEENILAINCD